jgi:hypothetical protein
MMRRRVDCPRIHPASLSFSEAPRLTSADAGRDKVPLERGRAPDRLEPVTEPQAQPQAEAVQCSAKDCRRDALWALRWNNPKIHTPDRRKVWLACDEHREQLTQFLDRRSFLRDVIPVDALEATDG